MNQTTSPNILTVYIGFDPRDWPAYMVACRSLLTCATVPIQIIPIVERDLRRAGVYSRPFRVDPTGQRWDLIDDKPFSTEFSFTRFAVPFLEDYANRWVLFVDADVMFRGDVAEILQYVEADQLDNYDVALYCVHHAYEPGETDKMDGVIQSRYRRKNWSSVMLMNPAKCTRLGLRELNTWTGSELHQMRWLDDEDIGALPADWNWLQGWDNPDADPRLVHYTRGTPDMLDEKLPWADEWWRYLHAVWPPVRYPLLNPRKDEPAEGVA